ncbi:hypothetical protein ACSYAD_36635, partial [Acaryochloris marina NIES-2412]|uniref:hypothetical protein n=1 Tax=Acaryochloris marina TaxID=155978 RepID=UPI004059B103
MQCLEPLTPLIEIQELREVGCDWIGGLRGCYAIGHYDPVAFAQAVDPDCPTEAHQVRHEYWMEYFLEMDGDCICFRKCNADIEGA